MAKWTAATRRGVWEALMHDDPETIALHLTSRALVETSAKGLWNPSKATGKRNTSILDVMALQRTGVNGNLGQALRCLRWLLDTFPEVYNAKDIEWAIRKAKAKNHDDVATILSLAI